MVKKDNKILWIIAAVIFGILLINYSQKFEIANDGSLLYKLSDTNKAMCSSGYLKSNEPTTIRDYELALCNTSKDISNNLTLSNLYSNEDSVLGEFYNDTKRVIIYGGKENIDPDFKCVDIVRNDDVHFLEVYESEQSPPRLFVTPFTQEVNNTFSTMNWKVISYDPTLVPILNANDNRYSVDTRGNVVIKNNDLFIKLPVGSAYANYGKWFFKCADNSDIPFSIIRFLESWGITIGILALILIVVIVIIFVRRNN